MIDIELQSPKTEIIESEPYANCLLSLENDKEDILIPLSFWSLKDYQAHWFDALNSFLNDEANSTFLLTEMYDLEYANFLKGLALYRKGQSIVIQEHIVFLEELDFEFNPKESFRATSEYTSESEDGYEISEWVVTQSELMVFCNKIKDQLN